MTELPAPMTPPDCDLRDYAWMPLDVRRLLTSETWVLGSSEVKVASVTLWCEAWQQVPAASLPDNDRMLAHLSMAGAGWKKIAAEVLASWVKCEDGRLYHPVVAEKAREAWALKQAQRQRTEAARQAKAAARASKTTDDGAPPVTESVTETVTRPVARLVTMSVTEPVTEDVTGSTLPNLTRPDLKVREDTPSLRSVPQNRGSRLPDDWAPSTEEFCFAVDLKLNPNAVAAKFRDYWHGKPGAAGRKSDWTATWRNWCRSDAERRKPEREDPLAAVARTMGLFNPEPEPFTPDARMLRYDA